MNKKALLLAEETVKMVIAVIALTFLVYFLTSLYLSNQNDKDLELAKESLDFLVKEINAGQSIVEIYNPSGWVITSWKNNHDQPKTCSNMAWENCICICDSIGAARRFIIWLPLTATEEEVQSAYCDKLGSCADSDKKISSKIKIEKPLPIFLNIEGDQIVKNG